MSGNDVPFRVRHKESTVNLVDWTQFGKLLFNVASHVKPSILLN